MKELRPLEFARSHALTLTKTHIPCIYNSKESNIWHAPNAVQHTTRLDDNDTRTPDVYVEHMVISAMMFPVAGSHRT